MQQNRCLCRCTVLMLMRTYMAVEMLPLRAHQGVTFYSKRTLTWTDLNQMVAVESWASRHVRWAVLAWFVWIAMSYFCTKTAPRAISREHLHRCGCIHRWTQNLHRCPRRASQVPIVSCLLLFVIDRVSHNCFPSVEERDCVAIAVCFLLVAQCALCDVYSRCLCPVRYHFGKKRGRRSLSLNYLPSILESMSHHMHILLLRSCKGHCLRSVYR